MPVAVVADYDAIPLEMAQLQSLQQSLTMEAFGVRGLYVHSVATISFVVHPLLSQPEAIAREEPPPPPPRTFPEAQHPAVAFEALKRRLLVPRKKLRIYAGSRAVLESPVRFSDGSDAQVDAVAGPVPLSLTLNEVWGDRTLFCTFRVQTWQPTCLGTSVFAAPTLLSNQFEMSNDIAYPEYRQVVTTRGTAVFNAAFLAARAPGGVTAPFVPADFLRGGWVLPPAFPGFTRSVRLRPTGDGTSVEYQTRDEETPPMWGVRPAGYITRIEGWQEISSDTQFLLTNALNHTLHLQVWGYPYARSHQLVAALLLAAGSIRNRFGFTLNSVLGGGSGAARDFLTKTSLRVNFPHRTAALTLSKRMTGRLATVAAIAGAPQIGNLDNYAEDFGPFVGPARSGDLGQQPPPPDSIMGLMHGLLMAQCDTPPPAGPARGNYNLRP